MPKSDTPSTNNSFWTQLQKDIDIMGVRAKNKIHKHNQIKLYLPSKLSSTPKAKSIQISESCNQIRERQHIEQNIENTIKNRLTYQMTSKNRKVQTAQLAKRKYQKVIQVRNKSFHEKKSLSKQRKLSNSKYLEQSLKKVSRVKSERSNVDEARKIFFTDHVDKANEIRRASIENQDKIKKQTCMSLHKKQMQVITCKRAQGLSRIKLQANKSDIIESGKINHHLKKFEQIRSIQLHSNRNVKLFKKVNQKLQSIVREKQKAQKELKSFESFLGYRWPKTHRLANNSIKQKTNSFYLTNF